MGNYNNHSIFNRKKSSQKAVAKALLELIQVHQQVTNGKHMDYFSNFFWLYRKLMDRPVTPQESWYIFGYEFDEKLEIEKETDE